MLRSSLLVVAIFIAGAGAGHAQVTSDPQAVAPVVYSGTPKVSADCASDVASDVPAPDCIPGGESAAVDHGAIAYAPEDYDYVPDYWEEPVYTAPFYLGVSLIPDYWGWPYYGWGFGWPYYGYASFGFGWGWPYYGYCCYWGGYWNSYGWNGHHDGWGHHGGHGDHGGWGDHAGHGDHGGWGDHGGHGNHDYHGPYRYMGHGMYADQAPGSGGGNGGHGDRQPRAASSATAQTSAANFTRTGTAPAAGNTFAGPQAASARFATPTNSPAASQGRFAGRTPLPSASYYASARAGGNAAVATSAYRGATPANYRGSATGAGYVNGRGNGAASQSASQSYRVTSMPGRGYAATNYAAGRGTMARSSAYMAQRDYVAQRASSYPQQRYVPANRAYAGARGSMPSYSGARGPMPSYSGARGPMPSYSGARGGMSYARSGPVSAPRGGYSGASAPHSGGGSARGSGHAGNSRGH